VFVRPQPMSFGSGGRVGEFGPAHRVAIVSVLCTALVLPSFGVLVVRHHAAASRHAVDEWRKYKVGEVTVSIPADWTEVGDDAADERGWCLGEPEEPTAIFNVVRSRSFNNLIADMDAHDPKQVKLAGRSAARYVGRAQGDPPGRCVLVVLDERRPSGHRLGFLCYAAADEWEVLSLTFERILRSVVLVEPAGEIPHRPGELPRGRVASMATSAPTPNRIGYGSTD
jgi:hypothetical protein